MIIHCNFTCECVLFDFLNFTYGGSLTAVGLTNGGSSTVHTFTHEQYVEKHNENRIYRTERT